MDYICYISRSKVDNLHAQLEPEKWDDTVEQVVVEKPGGRELRAGLFAGGIMSLFQGGITYGRKNVIQRERKVKIAYVEKLREVLLGIAADHGDIPDIREALSANRLDSVYYFHEGLFTVRDFPAEPTSSDVVTLHSSVGKRSLLLDCSLRYFSEGPEPDGTFLIHSGNHRFFTGGLALPLSGVFVLLGLQDEAVVGTPLYLRLAANLGEAL